MKIKAMTFNIQHGLDYLNGDLCPELAANTVRAFSPDFCVLNEVYGPGDGSCPPEFGPQAQIIAGLSGMKYSVFCPAITVCGKPYGNALLSRTPILSCRTVPIPEPVPHGYPGEYYENRCVFVADLGSYTVMGSHFGLPKDERESAVSTVLSLISEQEKPLIFCGDLNSEPDDPVLSPLFRNLNDTAAVSTEPILTFPSDAPKSRIDYIFVSGQFKVLSAVSPAVTASDHRPYMAELELSSPGTPK